MDKNYRAIMLKMDNIIKLVYEIGELAESTSCFPVRSYVKVQDDLQDFYNDLRGAIKKDDELKYAQYMFRKVHLNSIYGMCAYTDTDSLKRKSDEDGHQD